MARVRIKYTSDDGNERIFSSLKSCSEEIGRSPSFISKCVNDCENPQFQRIETEPKPKPVKDPDADTSIVIRTSHAKKAQFLAAIEILGTTSDVFIDTAMKNAVLNGISVIEDGMVDTYIDTEVMRDAVMKSWARTTRIGPVPADTFE